MKQVEPTTDWHVTYLAKGYSPTENGVLVPELTGDVNAILDYRFTASDKLDWYFDHHVSAFGTPAERESYEARKLKGHLHHDGGYGSCTKLIVDIGKSVYGASFDGLEDLIEWADIIDRAAFPSAQMAVDRKEPVLQMMTVIEHLGDASMVARLAAELTQRNLNEVASSALIQEAYYPFAKARDEFTDLVLGNAKEEGPVILVDLLDQVTDVAGKFITYAHWPSSVYSVMATRSASKIKLSIGYNPWSGVPRIHNIAKICERHGGGGHPVVGAISLPVSQIEAARALALDITRELSRSTASTSSL
jgi:hypothetical protein